MMNFLDDHIIVINVVNILSQSSKKILKYFTLYVLLVICEIKYKYLLKYLLTKIKVFGKYLKPDLPFSRNVDFASKGKLC